MITDDINITWKLEKRFYDIRFETQAFCWTMVPHTLKKICGIKELDGLRVDLKFYLSIKCLDRYQK